MVYKIVISVLAHVMLLMPVCYGSSNIAIEQRLWRVDLSASGRYVSSAYTGNIDLQKDLGFQNSQMPETRILWDINDSHSLRLDYFRGQFIGAANRTQRREFFGGLISREFKAHADETLDMKLWKIGWIHYVNRRPSDKIRVGYFLNVETISVRGVGVLTSKMEGSLPVQLTGQSSRHITAPTIGIVITGKPTDRLEYFIECGGMTTGKQRMMFVDYEANIHWFIDAKKHTSLVAGYHVINYDDHQITTSSRLHNVRLAGAFYGLEQKF